MILRFCAALAAILFIGAAQAWPDRTVTLLVPFPPGGALDISARILGPHLSKELGQPVIVENRAGATGSIGSNAVAKAPPDGYLLLWSSLSSHAIHGILYGNTLPYDLEKNFTAINVFGAVPMAMVVNPSVKANTLAELIALAKAKPGSLSFASSGNGSVQHLSGELFQRLAGVQLLHVPYKGIGPSVIGLVGGQVDIGIESLPATLPHVRAGKLRALMVGSSERVPFVPDVPTPAEAGLRGFEVGIQLFFFAPAGTPAPIVNRLNGAMKAMLERPAVKELLLTQAIVPVYQTPEEAAQVVRAEIAKWTKVIRDANIKPE
jgi:tripartite-type tricarboxylate transporter receptor subunit TctC